jgi:uncharacterized membrane protein
MKKAPSLLIFAVSIAVLLLPIHQAFCQNYVEYNVQINSDGSAAWRIIQVLDINAPVDSWTEFQQKTLSLVYSAVSVSHREMTLDFDSLQIDTSISAESKTTEYLFTWQNFSIVQGQLITFGDVFLVDDFFGKLYGDASLSITYPSTFAVKSVSPAPSERDNQTQMLGWYRTQDFVSGNPKIVLTSGNPAENGISGEWLLYTALGTISAAAAAVIAGFVFLRRRRANAKAAAVTITPAVSAVETDEEKVIKIIKSSGGTVRQSAITEQTRFSKAKTSQLLAALEQRGVVRRVKKGRDKIVSLNNEKQRGAQT